MTLGPNAAFGLVASDRIGYDIGMTNEFESGDEVEFDSNVSKGAKKTVVKGTVETEITEPTKVDGHKVNASPDDPKYLIETKDGEEIHGGSALRKR